MLRRLRIENFVLIREADLAFAPGLNAVTGETGAGKTILAQAIGLLLGAPGDPAYLGPGAQEAYVEAELDLPDGALDDIESLAELRPEGEKGLVAARRVFAERRPGEDVREQVLVQVVDRPGTDQDKAVFRLRSDAGVAYLTMGRRDGAWVGESLDPA